MFSLDQVRLGIKKRSFSWLCRMLWTTDIHFNHSKGLLHSGCCTHDLYIVKNLQAFIFAENRHSLFPHRSLQHVFLFQSLYIRCCLSLNPESPLAKYSRCLKNRSAPGYELMNTRKKPQYLLFGTLPSQYLQRIESIHTEVSRIPSTTQ